VRACDRVFRLGKTRYSKLRIFVHGGRVAIIRSAANGAPQPRAMLALALCQRGISHLFPQRQISPAHPPVAQRFTTTRLPNRSFMYESWLIWA
jgi:hypothetical protein